MNSPAGARPGPPSANGGTPVRPGSRADPLDVLGVGFGPSNLALAIAAEELDPRTRRLFLERNDGVYWHPGMLIDGARMQISYLKDLVSLRNPSSPYTFLNYLKARGRLERFVNLDVSRPTRLEYQDYLSWVARHFDDSVRYGAEVVRITPVPSGPAQVLDLLRVTARDTGTGRLRHYYARNVVYAAGGARRGPGEAGSAAVIHSSTFLPDFPERFPRRDAAQEFAVVGDGQSTAEIVSYVLNGYPNSRVHLVVSGYALRGTDNNPFVNEQFYRSNAARFYASDPRARAALRSQLRNTNYGVVEPGLLQELFELTYADEVRGRQRLVVHGGSEVTGVVEDGDRPTVTVRDRATGSEQAVRCDGVVLATGYTRALAVETFGDLLPLLRRDESGDLAVSPDYRVHTEPEVTAGLYLQGFAEPSFGLGDTLLSLLPFRSEQIVTDIGRTAGPRRPPAPAVAAYPPTPFVERDLDKVYALMARFNFASVISSDGSGEVMVTQLPLILDRSQGECGVLLGHLDRANPQVRLLAAGRATVVFHGPNAYLSPHSLDSDQLPTWNSMAVHVRGRTRLFSGRQALLHVFGGLCEGADPDPSGYRLRPNDERIDQLIDYVVGLEIVIEELVGRFKLSQNLDERDRRSAASDMVRAGEADQRSFLEWMFEVDGVDGVNGARNGSPVRGQVVASGSGAVNGTR